MKEYPLVCHGQEIGRCTLQEDGLYWIFDCRCRMQTNRVERVYSGSRRIGVLEKEGEQLVCRRRVSKRSFPELPPAGGLFSVTPMEPSAPWNGTLLGQPRTGYQTETHLLFPYLAEEPCPCEPLICFFEIKDGFWQLPKREEWLKKPDEA